MTTPTHPHVRDAQSLLTLLGFSGAQANELAALTLLARIDLTPDKQWSDATARLIGVTPMMDWIRTSYGRQLVPNTRETVRKAVMHHLVERGVALYNPDDPTRPVNSPKAAYQIADHALALLRAYASDGWNAAQAHYTATYMQAVAAQAQAREAARLPMTTPDGRAITLSPGPHSALIRDVVELFAPRFTPGARLLYLGDTGDKWAHHDADAFGALGLTLDPHGKMPDVVLWWEARLAHPRRGGHEPRPHRREAPRRADSPVHHAARWARPRHRPPRPPRARLAHRLARLGDRGVARRRARASDPPQRRALLGPLLKHPGCAQAA